MPLDHLAEALELLGRRGLVVREGIRHREFLPLAHAKPMEREDVELVKPHFPHEGADLVEVLLGVIEALDDRRAQDETSGAVGARKGTDVLQHLLVSHARVLAVLVGVHALEVVEGKVHVAHHAEVDVCRGRGLRLDGLVDICLVAALQHGEKELGLEHGVAAREGHAAIARPVVAVALEDVHDLLDRILLGYRDQGIVKACLHALERGADVALLPVELHGMVRVLRVVAHRAIGAGIQAARAALVGAVHAL